MKSTKWNRLPMLLILSSSLLTVSAESIADQSSQAQAAQLGDRTFADTGKTVRGRFLEYWDSNGGLPQQGYPISEELQERSDTDGKTYTVQYFERAVFELHPENTAPNDVLLSLLGTFLYKQKYPVGAPGQTPSAHASSRSFQETGKRVGGVFLDYWNTHGGLAQQGFPISEEFDEVSDLDGKTYLVQYFERAVFEFHPENQPPYDVLLAQLGTFRYRATYLQPPAPVPAPPVAGSATPEPLPTTDAVGVPQPPEYAAVRARFENMVPEQWKAAGYTENDACDPGIGVRVWNMALWEAQFYSGQPDPQNPPILFADRNSQKLIGLQWTAVASTEPTPVVFGQEMFIVTPGGEQRYALFSWFKPNGHVLFARADRGDPCKR
jgi:hypothetical protein